MSIRLNELSESAIHQSSDRPDVYAPITSGAWNAAHMQNLNLTRDDRLPSEFGMFSLFQATSAELALTPMSAQKLDLQSCSSS